jgi:hypothetical protein
MYRVKSTGEIKSQGEVRSMYPNTSFPSQWTPALVEELGLDPVFESPTPTTTRYQTAYKDGVEQDAQGRWLWKWSISEMDDETKAAKDAEQAKAVRATRDGKLAECDWVVIKNLELNQNIPGVWEVYRQGLRDVPAQAGFPHDITWPEKP